jgi:hypothetical protein
MLIWDKVEHEMCKIRLASQGTKTGEFGHIHVNHIVALGIWVGKTLKGFARLTGHG